MNRQFLLALPLAAVVAVALGACSSQSPGNPAPDPSSANADPTSQPGSVSSNADPLAAVDPCSLIDASVLTKNGLVQENSGEEAGARFCDWQRNSTNTDPTKLNGYALTVNIYDRVGLKDLNTNGFVITPYQSFGQRQAEIIKDNDNTSCDVAIEISSSSRIEVGAVPSSGGIDTACTLAEAAAPSVVKNLPAGA